jgi:uncharacterized Zn finger protein
MSIDHKFTPEAVCPHCGHEHNCSHEFFSNWGDHDEVLAECEECGAEFTLTRHTEVTYSTEKIKETT